MAFVPAHDAIPRMTVEEYLRHERLAEERHEYLDGTVYAMAGESPDHGRICINLVLSLGPQLRDTPCELFSKDLKVRCGPLAQAGQSQRGLFAYPDLVVVCGPLQFHDQVRDVVLNPTVLIEVLSPSTEAFDRGEKFRRYQRWLPTLTDYVLVAQDRPVVNHYTRPVEVGAAWPTGRRWEYMIYEGLEAVVPLERIGCTLTLRDVYARITLAPSEEEDLDGIEDRG
jgi:Uma2 family endonuclease